MWPGPYGEWGSRKYVIASCDQSLKRMGLDYFDIFYIHRPNPTTPLEETHYALEMLIQQGKALYGGVSNYPADLTDASMRLHADNKWAPLTIHQPRYNLLDRVIEEGLTRNASEHGYGIIAFSPLAQGLLTDKYIKKQYDGSRFQKNHGLDNKELRQIEALQEVARDRNQSLAQMALAWILRLNEVTSVLTAVSKLSQLEDSLKILDNLDFTSDEIQRIDNILSNKA